MRKFLAAIAVTFALGACASLPLQAPPTAEQQLAAIELAFSGVVEQLVSARVTGVITEDATWRCAQQFTRSIDEGFDSAHRYLVNNQSIAIVIGNLRVQLQQLQRIESTGENVCDSNGSNPSHFRHPPSEPPVGHRV